MDQEITVGVQAGAVSFSFKTDRSGSNVKEAVRAIKGILSANQHLLESLGLQAPIKPSMMTLSTVPDITVESLSIPNEVKEGIVTNLRRISRLKLVMILLSFSKGLTYKNIMALSRQLGKPIAYGWLNTDFQRKEHREFIRSEPVPGSQEKLYSLTEPGRRRADAIIDEVKENPKARQDSSI